MIKITNRNEEGTRRRVQLICEGKSLTEQSHKNEVNINKIMAKYKKTGFINRTNKVPLFGDFTTANDFQTIQNKLAKANSDFMSLPAEYRKRFDNDPAKLIEFINNPENAEECFQMGLIEKPVPEIINSEISSPEEAVMPQNEPSAEEST